MSRLDPAGLRHRVGPTIRSTVLLARGVLLVGRRHRCPVCGWRVRGFVGEGRLVARSAGGYCPRCNVKARHRRVWRHLEEHVDLGAGHRIVVEIAPWLGLARALRREPAVEHHGIDLAPMADRADVGGDARALPVRTGAVDLVLCIHVLEHIDEDRTVITEIHRCLRPGGVAIVSVPLDLDHPTDEDPTITDPAARAERFGEPGHVRTYGVDLADRLVEAGFEVSLHLEDELGTTDGRHHGLRGDEHVFHCVKPR